MSSGLRGHGGSRRELTLVQRHQNKHHHHHRRRKQQQPSPQRPQRPVVRSPIKLSTEQASHCRRCCCCACRRWSRAGEWHRQERTAAPGPAVLQLSQTPPQQQRAVRGARYNYQLTQPPIQLSTERGKSSSWFVVAVAVAVAVVAVAVAVVVVAVAVAVVVVVVVCCCCRRWRWDAQPCADASSAGAQITYLLCRFYAENDHFTETGSGQT